MQNCHYCNYSCEEYLDLAKHILKEKSGHDAGKFWAQRFVLKHAVLKPKDQGGMPLTEAEKEAKRSTQRELSGREKPAQTYCPSCNSLSIQVLPIEFVTSNFAWRKQGTLVVSCSNCRK